LRHQIHTTHACGRKEGNDQENECEDTRENTTRNKEKCDSCQAVRSLSSSFVWPRPSCCLLFTVQSSKNKNKNCCLFTFFSPSLPMARLAFTRLPSYRSVRSPQISSFATKAICFASPFPCHCPVPSSSSCSSLTCRRCQMEPPLLLRILLPLASLSWLLLLTRGSAGRCPQILVSPLLLACFVFVLFCSTDADCPPGLVWAVQRLEF